MIKIYDNLLSDEICDKLFHYVVGLVEKTQPNNDVKTTLPWVGGFDYPIWKQGNRELSDIVLQHQNNIAQKIKEDYDEVVYPEFSDLVFWQPGNEMRLHSDDQHDKIANRHLSSVTYLNDDYRGGETYFESGFVCKPKKGRTVVFHSDVRDLHGVRRITRNNRVTLSIWFTRNEEAKENIYERCI